MKTLLVILAALWLGVTIASAGVQNQILQQMAIVTQVADYKAIKVAMIIESLRLDAESKFTATQTPDPKKSTPTATATATPTETMGK